MEALIPFVLLIVIGFVMGRSNEQRHYRELAALEATLGDIAVSNERATAELGAFESGMLVVGSVVIAEDYFKRVAAALKSVLGGNLQSYETLLERGRREAIVRMKEEARRRGVGGHAAAPQDPHDLVERVFPEGDDAARSREELVELALEKGPARRPFGGKRLVAGWRAADDRGARTARCGAC